MNPEFGERQMLHTKGILPFGLWGVLAGLPLLLLVIWNWTDPLPPAWDEAQHLLQAQAFGAHLRRFRWDPLWWQQFLHLNQRYPPLVYWLGIPLAVAHPFSRADGQLLNLLVLGILALVTQRIGRRVYASMEIGLRHADATGWLAAGLLLLYPGITSLAHVYMLELVLVLTVALAFWAMLAYWQEPSWQGAVGVGAAVAAVLLTKWTGVLFLLLPLTVLMGRALWKGLKGKGWQKGIPLAQIGLGMGVTLLLCWPWYRANWLFVLSNGFGYTSTAHYYITCAAGSLCWWTTYLRLLPQQMSPFLCGLPLLALWPWAWKPVVTLGRWHERASEPEAPQKLGWGSLNGQEPVLWATYGSGYLLYTLVDIKDVRFTLPLLPLLAVLSAGGIQQAWAGLQERLHQSGFPFGGPRGGVWVGLVLGSLALWNFGQPFTPGVAAFGQGMQMRWQGQHPEQELTDWIALHAANGNGSWVQPGLTTTLGVLPNTELISSETLTYLAALHRWPVTFRAAGQTPWPELELSLLEGFVDAEGEQGIVGPYGPAKEQIRQHLRNSPDWRQDPVVDLPAVGRLRTYSPRWPQVTVQEAPIEAVEVELGEITPLPELGIPAWRLQWQGPAKNLAQTLVWARLENEQGQVLAERAWVLGQNRLQPNSKGNWLVEEILALPLTDSLEDALEPEGSSFSRILYLEWQPPQGIRHSLRQPWTGSTSTPLAEGSRLLADPLLPLRQAAAAASVGDLEALSLHLNAWTTLQYATFLTDPDRTLTRQLLEGEWQQAAAQGWLSRQIQSHYELGLLLVALLQPEAAQSHFQQIVELDPEDDWARAYLAFLRVLFTHDFVGVQGLRQELSSLVQPFCQKTDLNLDLAWVCSTFQAEQSSSI
jgi:4-amino-4-deoxy-L-arabinose transferase-like glycosyltransferase